MNVKSKFTFSILIILFCFSCKPDPKPEQSNNDTVQVRLQSDLTTLNPYLYRTNLEANAIGLLYSYPLEFDYATLKLSPQLAKGLPVVEEVTEGDYAGGKSFTFEFFEEAVWDDGTPITGHDYAFTMKMIFNPKMLTQRFAAWIDYIRDVQVNEANPKQFTVYTAKHYLIDIEALSNYIILPKHLYDPEGVMDNFTLPDLTDAEKAKQMADEDPRLQQVADIYHDPKYSRDVFHGSGPYKMVEWVEGQVIAFEKKENWWGDQLAENNPMLQAFPKRIEFKPIKDNGAAMVALQDGEIDVMNELDSKEFLEAREQEFLKDKFNFYTPNRLSVFTVCMNNDNPKLNDKRVRRAFAHCYDMEELIDVVYEGLATPAVGPFLPFKSYYNSDMKLIPKDLDKAKSLLAEAGWEDSNGNGIVDKDIDGELTEMSLEFLYDPAIPFQDNMSQLLMTTSQQIGVEIVRVPVEINEKRKRVKAKDYEITGSGFGANPVPDDPKQYWHCDSAKPGGSNYSGFCNDEADELIDAIRAETDIAKRDEMYRSLQAIIYEEQPQIFLFSPMNKVIVSKNFKDPVISSIKFGVSLQHLQ